MLRHSGPRMATAFIYSSRDHHHPGGYQTPDHHVAFIALADTTTNASLWSCPPRWKVSCHLLLVIVQALWQFQTLGFR
ncbi:hypothetical protein NDU88_001592 [Pleurodeles waltl]|uniref:Uncharacterized protein n=1 Tax=Pleurodeles waltl TaxID=8319 RepID=A0AAV7TJA6_PLEWA|nr:hypothetical protein NDU88_001592 [Pleurodeles waltl]